jgi:hypothetical protein
VTCRYHWLVPAETRRGARSADSVFKDGSQNGVVPGALVMVISGSHPGSLIIEIKGSRLGWVLCSAEDTRKGDGRWLRNRFGCPGR